jgi:hypothetical protein
MGSVEERVAYLEGRGEEHAAAIGEVRADIRDLRTELRDFRVDVNQRFDRVDAKFDRLEARFDTKFFWLIGFQFTTLIAVIAALLNGYFR